MTAKHEKLLAALLGAARISDAAKVAGISEATALRYMKEPDFITAYRELRAEAVTHAVAQLSASASDAVATLRAVASDEDAPASSRVAAARSILDLAIRGVELDGLNARVEQLEQLMKEQPNGN